MPPEDNQVPCFRRVFLTLHVMFSSMTGVHSLNSTASPQHSHQNFVLKEDDGLWADCTEKAVEIQTLSLSNRNDREERTVLDAYLEMTGSSSKKCKKGRQIHEDRKRKEATEPELINSDSARQQEQSARELINET